MPRVLLFKLVNRYSCRAELAFCSARYWVCGLLGYVQIPSIFTEELRRRERIVCVLNGLYSLWREATVADFFHTKMKRGLKLCNSDGKYEEYITCIKVKGIFGCWDKSSICERGQIVAPSSKVPCLLQRRGAGWKFLTPLQTCLCFVFDLEEPKLVASGCFLFMC